MAEHEVTADSEPTALYEIRLQGSPPEPLRREFPEATLSTTRTETILFHRVERPAELDDLIDRLLSRGFVLTEVHEVPPLSPPRMMPRESSRDEGLFDGDNV